MQIYPGFSKGEPWLQLWKQPEVGLGLCLLGGVCVRPCRNPQSRGQVIHCSLSGTALAGKAEGFAWISVLATWPYIQHSTMLFLEPDRVS